MRSHQYADNIQLYSVQPLDPKVAMKTLNIKEKVIKWMRANKVTLNPDQMQVLLVGSNLSLGSIII